MAGQRMSAVTALLATILVLAVLFNRLSSSGDWLRRRLEIVPLDDVLRVRAEAERNMTLRHVDVVVVDRDGKTQKAGNGGNVVDKSSRGGGCLTLTPGDPRTPFPCATRAAPLNSVDAFFRWPAEEEARKEALLAPIIAACRAAGVTSVNLDAAGKRPTAGGVRLVGCDGASVVSGRWNRCWIVPLMADSATPVCEPGDFFDVAIESENAKVAVDRVIDLDNGIFEVQFYIRKLGRYTVSVDLVLLHQHAHPGSNRMRLSESDTIGRVITSADVRSVPTHKVVGAPPTPAWPLNARNFSVAVTAGVDVVPVQVPCAASNDSSRFLHGAWVRGAIDPETGACDGVHCAGTAPHLGPLLGGWFWAADACVLQVYDAHDLRRLLAGAWAVGWGGSTMKQPMSNFVEYHLGQNIFKYYMVLLDQWRSSRKAGFFHYREWDVTAAGAAPKSGVPRAFQRPSRWTMLWGGCPNIVAAPTACPREIGLASWYKAEAVLGPQGSKRSGAGRSNSSGISDYPTVMFLDFYMWKFPTDDEKVFSEQLENLIDKIDDAARRANQKRPLLVLHAGPTGANAAGGVRPHSFPPAPPMMRHMNWVLEDFALKRLATRRDPSRGGDGAGAADPAFVYIARDKITLPLHFSDQWVHFGVHYGATEGMCNTGHSRSGYEFAKCVRKTWADEAVMIMWMNAYARHIGVVGTDFGQQQQQP